MVSAEQREAAARATQEQGAKETAQRKAIEAQIAASNVSLHNAPGSISTGKTFAQVQLERLYRESGVVTDSGGNVIYNPADLGAERERAQKEITGQPFATISGSPSQQYQASVDAAAQRAIDLRQAKVTTALQQKQKEQTELERAEQKALQELSSVESKLNAPQVLGSSYIDKNTGKRVERYQPTIGVEETDRLINQRKSLSTQLSTIATQKKSVGADIANLQKANRDIISFKTSTRTYAGIFQTSQKPATQILQEKQAASAARISGVTAGIKSVVQPIKYTQLRGTGITARTFKSVSGKPATTENLLGVVGKPVTQRNRFVIGQAGGKAPSRGLGPAGFDLNVFGRAGGAIAKQLGFSTSIQKFPAKTDMGFNLLPTAYAETSNIDYSGIESTLSDIRQKGGRQVTITSPSGKRTTVPIDQALDVIKGSPQQGSYGFEFFGAPTAEQRQVKIQALKSNQKKIQDVINDARSTGTGEITIIEKGGKKTTVPLSRAFYDITQAFKRSPELGFEYGGISAAEKTANISAVQKSAVKQIGDFTSQAKADFADEITIKSEDGTVKTVPLAQAQLEIRRATAGGKKVELSYIPLPKPITTTDVLRGLEKRTGINLGLGLPVTQYIDTTFELGLPKERRSSERRYIPGVPKEVFSGISNKELGEAGADIANFGAEVYDFGRASAKQVKSNIVNFIQPPSKGSVFPRIGTVQLIKAEKEFKSPPPYDILKGITGQPQEGTLSNILGLPVPRKETPQQQTAVSKLISGQPVNLLESEQQASLAGTFGLQVGFIKLFEGAGKIGGTKGAGPKEVKLKIRSSYEIPDTMRKPPGEAPRPMRDLYTEPLKLDIPGRRTTKDFAKANLAQNVMRERLTDLTKAGSSESMVRFNPNLGKVDIQFAKFKLGRGRGFVPEGGGSGGAPAGRPPTGGTPTVKVTKIGDTVKIQPPTPDIFESPVYENLGQASPKFQTTSVGPVGGVGDIFRLAGRDIRPVPSSGPYRFFEKLMRARRNPELEERRPYKFYPRGAGPDVEPIDLTGRIDLGFRNLLYGLGSTKRTTTRVPLGQGKPITVDVGVKFPSLSITPIRETKAVKPAKQPRLKLEERSMIEKQVEKIVSLDIAGARAERSAVKEVKLNVNIDDLFRRAGFKSVYRTKPDVLPTIYEPQTAKIIRKPGIGKAILEGRPINLGSRGLPTATQIRRARQPLITIPRVDFPVKTIQLETPKTKTRRDSRIGLVTIPATGQPPITKTLTIPKLDTPQKEKTKTGIVTIPDIPQERITELRFPGEPPPQRARGGFFLPFGGGGGGTPRRGGRTRKIFYTNPSDPLRAGVIMAQGVPELASRSPKIFRQVDILLGKSRKRNKFAGLDQPWTGLNVKDTLNMNLNIKI